MAQGSTPDRQRGASSVVTGRLSHRIQPPDPDRLGPSEDRGRRWHARPGVRSRRIGPMESAGSGGLEWEGQDCDPTFNSPDALIYAIAALAAIGILMLWLRRKRKTQDAL